MIGNNRVVITGLGVLAANGIGKDPFWTSLLEGKSGIGPITQFDTSDIPWKIAGEVNDFSPTDFISLGLKPKRQSRNTQMAAAATTMALEDAGLTKTDLEKVAPIHVILGISLGGLDLVETHTRRLIDKGMNKGLPTVASCVHVIASSFIATMLEVATNISVISNSCTGGLDAIAAGAAAIRRGETEIAIVGGADAVIIPSVVTGLGLAGMLSTESDHPDTISKPFDLKRSGGVLSEGAGVLILENMEHAKDRGVHQYAEITGYGTASNINIPLYQGLQKSMQAALDSAGYHASDVSYINAHGTSDPDLDLAETMAIKAVFKKDAYHIPISSIKGTTGNPLAGGGPIQAIASCLSIDTGILPPTSNYTVTDPDCDLDYTPNTPRKFSPHVVLVNSHGTGSVNGSLLLESL